MSVQIQAGAVTHSFVNGAAFGSLGATTTSGGSGTISSVSWTSTGTPITAQTLAAKVNLKAGVYTVTVTDVDASTATYQYTITEPAAVKEIAFSFKSDMLSDRNSFGIVPSANLGMTTVTTASADYPKALDLSSNTASRNINLPSLPATTAWTMEFRAYSNVDTTTAKQITRHNVNGNQGVRLANTAVSFSGSGFTSVTWTLPATSFSAWHHYAFVNDGTNFKGYQDGVLLGTAAASVMALGTSIDIGLSFDSNIFSGYLNDFLITNSVKYTAAFTPAFNLYVKPAAVTHVPVGGGVGSISATPTVIGGTTIQRYGWSSTGTAVLSSTPDALTGLAAGAYTLYVLDSAGRIGFYTYTIMQLYTIKDLACSLRASTLLDRNALGVVPTSNALIVTTTTARPDLYSKALSLNADGRSMQFTGITSTPRWTYEFWGKNTFATPTAEKCVTSDGNNRGVYLTNTTMRYRDANGTNHVLWYLPVNSIGSWHHYAIVNDGTILKGYQDGVFLGYGAQSGIPFPTSVTIGTVSNGLANVFTGFLQDFVFTNSDRYNGDFTPVASIYLTPGTVTHVSIDGSVRGSIASPVNIKGGSGQFSAYSWSSSGTGATSVTTFTTSSLSNLNPGAYTLRVNDSNGLYGECMYTINQLYTVKDIACSFAESALPDRNSIGAVAASSNVLITATTTARPDLYSKALSLNADGRSMQFTGITSTPRWTYEFWAKNTFATPTTELCVTIDGNNRGLYLTNTTMRYRDHNGTSYMLWYLPVNSIGSWHHYAIVNEGTLFKGYQDGVFLGYCVQSSIPFPTSVAIGYSFAFTGFVQDFVFTNVDRYSGDFTPVPNIYVTPGAVTHVSIDGSVKGSIAVPASISPPGQYSYSWTSTGSSVTSVTTASLSQLDAGTYTLTVTDSTGRTGSYTYRVELGSSMKDVAISCQDSLLPDRNSLGATVYANGRVSSTTTARSAYAKSMSLSGSEKNLNITGIPSPVSWTYEFWANNSSTSGSSTLLYYDFGFQGGNGYNCLITPTQISFSLINQTNPPIMYLNSSSSNSWHHYAFVRDIDTFRMYQDGQLLAYGAATSIFLSDRLAIGGVQFGGALPFTGYINDFVYSNIAKYKSNFTPVPSIYITPGAVGHVSIDGTVKGSIAAPVRIIGGSEQYSSYSWTSSGTSSIVTGATTAALSQLNAGTYILTVTDSTGRTGSCTYVVNQLYTQKEIAYSFRDTAIPDRNSLGVVSSSNAFMSSLKTSRAAYASSLALSADAKNVFLNSIASTATWTYEFWANYSSAGGSTLLQHDGGNYHKLNWQPLYMSYSLQNQNSPPTMYFLSTSVDTWHHYAFVKDTLTFRVYQDGQLLGHSPSSWLNFNPSSITLGGISTFFTGYMNDFVYTNTAKYSSEFTPTPSIYITPGLVTHVASDGQSKGAIAAPVSITGGSEQFSSYSWSSSSSDVTGITSASLSNIGAGTYTLTVTDSTGRIGSCTYIVNQLYLPKDVAFSFRASSAPDRNTLNVGTPSTTTVTSTATVGSNYAKSLPVTSTVGISLTSIPSSPQYTYEFWAYLNSTGTLYSANGGYGSFSTDAYNWFISAYYRTPALYSWHHYAIVNDGSIVRIYQDGSLLAYLPTNLVSTPSSFILGLSTLNGFVNDFVYSNTALYTSKSFSPYPTYSKGVVTNVSGPGAQNGSITAPSVTGTAPFTYRWSDASVTTASRSALSAGSYTLTVTDSAATPKVVVITYEVATPSIQVQATKVDTVSVFGSVTLSGVIGATGVYTYAWKKNGVDFSTSQNLTQLAPATYTCVITSGTVTKALTFTVNLIPPLQRYAFNGTLAGEGALNLALQDTTTTLGSPNYTAGPFQNTQALAITQTGRYVALPYSASLNFSKDAAFSFGGWFKVTSATSFPYFMSNTTASSGIELFSSLSKTVDNIAIREASVQVGLLSSTTTLKPIGEWNHRWVTYDGNLRLYYNGVLASSFLNVAARTFTSTQPWWIFGTARDTTYNQSIGAVADVRWYTGVVSASDIYGEFINVKVSSVDTLAYSGSATLVVTGGTGLYTYAWQKNGVAGYATTQNLTGLSPATYSCTITSGGVSQTVTVTVNQIVALQRYTFNGTLAGEGSLNLALQNTSTTLGTPSYTAGPTPGTQALILSSNTKYLELPYSEALSFANNAPWSAGGWFYSGGDATLMSNNTGTTNGLYLYQGSSLIQCIFCKSSATFQASVGSTYVANTWVHMWLSYDGSILRIYKNGALIYTSTSIASSNTPSPSSWYIGRDRANGNVSNLVGRVADVRWYNGYVNPLEVMFPPTLLQRYTFNGSLAGEGSLNLAFADPATTLGTATYSSGPTTASQALIMNYKSLKLPPSPELAFTGSTLFSIGGWFNTSQFGTSVYQLYLHSYKNGGGILWAYGSSFSIGPVISMNFGSSGANTPTATGIDPNTWYHHWAVYDGTNIYCYLNGVLLFTYPNARATAIGTSNPWSIGGDQFDVSSRSVFKVADVRWYSGIVPAAFAMTPLTALSVTATSTASTGSSGAITLTVNGGTPAIAYAWVKDGVSGFSTAKNLTGLAPGVYVCTVTSGIETATATATIAYVPPAFGSSVAISGSNIVVGAKGWSAKQDPSILGCGAMYVFSRTGSAWNQVYKISPNTTYPTAGGALGNSVSLNTTHIVGGSQLLNTSTVYKGAAVFKQVWFNVAGVITHSSYYGQNNGSITSPIIAFGAAPYTFKWSDNPGFTTSYRNNLGPGTYVLTISDSSKPAETKSYTYDVLEPAQLSATFAVVDCSEYDVDDGSITTTNITGGTAPLTILWSTGATTANVTGLGAGDYSLFIKDSLNYSRTLTVTVTEPSLSAASTGTTPISADIAWQTSRAPTLAISLYEIDYIRPDGNTIEGAVLTAGSSATVVGLTPSTTYTFKVYRVTNRAKRVRKPLATVTATTAPDVILNYTKASYEKTQIGTRAVYNLEKVDLVQAPIDFNSVFQTNDLVKVKTTIKQSEPAVVVKRGTTYTTPVLHSVLLPFTAEDGDDQEITIIETTTSLTKNVTYNPTEEAIVVDGVEHTAGSRFNTGKYKVSVCIAK